MEQPLAKFVHDNFNLIKEHNIPANIVAHCFGMGKHKQVILEVIALQVKKMKESRGNIPR